MTREELPAKYLNYGAKAQKVSDEELDGLYHIIDGKTYDDYDFMDTSTRLALIDDMLEYGAKITPITGANNHVGVYTHFVEMKINNKVMLFITGWDKMMGDCTVDYNVRDKKLHREGWR